MVTISCRISLGWSQNFSLDPDGFQRHADLSVVIRGFLNAPRAGLAAVAVAISAHAGVMSSMSSPDYIIPSASREGPAPFSKVMRTRLRKAVQTTKHLHYLSEISTSFAQVCNMSKKSNKKEAPALM